MTSGDRGGHCADCADPKDCVCPCDACIRAEGFQSREAFEECMRGHREAVRRIFGKPRER